MDGPLGEFGCLVVAIVPTCVLVENVPGIVWGWASARFVDFAGCSTAITTSALPGSWMHSRTEVSGIAARSYCSGHETAFRANPLPTTDSCADPHPPPPDGRHSASDARAGLGLANRAAPGGIRIQSPVGPAPARVPPPAGSPPFEARNRVSSSGVLELEDEYS